MAFGRVAAADDTAVSSNNGRKHSPWTPPAVAVDTDRSDTDSDDSDGESGNGGACANGTVDGGGNSDEGESTVHTRCNIAARKRRRPRLPSHLLLPRSPFETTGRDHFPLPVLLAFDLGPSVLVNWSYSFTIVHRQGNRPRSTTFLFR